MQLLNSCCHIPNSTSISLIGKQIATDSDNYTPNYIESKRSVISWTPLVSSIGAIAIWNNELRDSKTGQISNNFADSIEHVI